jgi:23S rRNA pseudouridine2605 synthase
MIKEIKPERLDKFLSNAGFAARRDMKTFLKRHNVMVNDKRITTLGFRVYPDSDVITIDGELVKKKGFVYFALNKPIGHISTTDDNWGRDSVVDLIDTIEKIYPIGRLDKDTHGLLLLTNDGGLTHKLIHPKFHVQKVYRLKVLEYPTEIQMQALKTGVLLRDGITLPAEVTIVENNEEKHMDSGSESGMTIMEMTIREGKNRQIRRMCETVGLTLIDLQRIQFGPIALGDLQPGEYRELTPEEVDLLQKSPEKKPAKV